MNLLPGALIGITGGDPEGPQAFGADNPIRTGIGNTGSVATSGNFTNQDINGLLSGTAWGTLGITYSFPASPSNYSGYPTGEPQSGFQALTATQQGVVRYALNLISQYTLLTFTQIAETDGTHAMLRFAVSSLPPTAWTYYPGTDVSSGDVWIGKAAGGVPTKGSYAFDAILHEVGHALGLKHGHEDDGVHGVLPAAHNSTEWSLMTYPSYIGGDTTFRNAAGSGNQTYMIDDIAALQYLYGANFSTNAGDTVYRWNPKTGEMSINGVGQGASTSNKIYMAIWDGGGNDTYNLSNYKTNLKIDLRPGEWSTFSTAQLADLDSSSPRHHLAHGNVANAYLYNNDPRSLIENAVGGAGNDTLIGNDGNNGLFGNGGNDTEIGNGGNDYLDGGAGKDPLSGGAGNDTIKGGAQNDTLNGGPGDDLLYGNGGSDSFVFDGGFGHDTIGDFAASGGGHDTINFATSVFANYGAVKSHMAQIGRDVVITYDGANAVTLKNVSMAALSSSDFTFHGAGAGHRAAPGAASPTMTADSFDFFTPTQAEQHWATHAVEANSHLHIG